MFTGYSRLWTEKTQKQGREKSTAKMLWRERLVFLIDFGLNSSTHSWTYHLTSLCLSFLLCKMGVIIINLEGCFEG